MYRTTFTRYLSATGSAVLLALLAWTFLAEPESPPMTGHADVAAFKTAYQHWKESLAADGDPVLHLPLAWSKAWSQGSTNARGQVSLDLASGALRAELSGWPEPQAAALWLVEKDRNGAARHADTRLLGEFVRNEENGKLQLETRIDRDALRGFTLDLAVVAPAGQTPQQAGLLFGTPGLFQRLYYGTEPWTIAQIGGNAAKPAASALPFEFLLPKPALALDSEGTTDAALEALIARGRDLFVKETFGGNGRTCATCHRPDNNYTIDPIYIAKLPKSDPLFIAETNPALANLEKPALLRQLGLILANVDGFDQPGVMRGVPHTLALSTSIGSETAADGGEFPADEAFANAMGWSGDGAPGDGSLRMFAQGAIAQHLPKTLHRVAGVDFREATDEELDAIAAYLLSLGRSEDPVLAKLQFTSPLVERGKLLFDTKQNPVDEAGQPIFGQTGNCNGCHANAGAMSSTTKKNPTRDTGIENMRDQPAHLLDTSVPYDGGFGKGPEFQRHNCGPDADADCIGDARFNTPSPIEAADTAPYFHNNSVSTLEETVAYYNTDAFNLSPGALTSKGANRQIKLDSSQVVAIAQFLRAINALENIRSSLAMDGKALKQGSKSARETLRLAASDTQDAVEVLGGGGLVAYPQALAWLNQALEQERAAAEEPFKALRTPRVEMAMRLKERARDSMVTLLP